MDLEKMKRSTLIAILKGASEMSIKSISWTGTGERTNSITFPSEPAIILSISIKNPTGASSAIVPLAYKQNAVFVVWQNGSSIQTWYISSVTYSADGLTMSITGNDAGSAFNASGTEYELLYI